MSKVTTQKPPSIAANGTAPMTPEQIVEQLRMLRQHIPDFAPLPVSDSVPLQRAAQVPDAMVQAAANTAGASPIVAFAIGRDAESLRGERVEVSRWAAVQDEALALAQGVVSSNLTRRHRLGLATLQAYGITRQLVRQREHAELLPYLAAMRQAGKFGRRRRSADPAPDPAAP